MWLLNKAEESPLFGSYSLKAHISSLRWLQQYPLAALCPPNSSATLLPPVDDVAFYPSHIWGKNSFSLLLAHIFFPICISPFFACSLSSFFTCLLEDLSSLFPPLAVCWSFSLKPFFSSPLYYLVFPTALCLQFSGKVWWKVRGEKVMMIIIVKKKSCKCWILSSTLENKMKPERKC